MMQHEGEAGARAAPTREHPTGDRSTAAPHARPSPGGERDDELFQKAFENAPIGMILARPDGRLTRVNDAFCAMTGYPRELLEGTDFRELIQAEDVESSAQELGRLLRGGRNCVFLEKRYNHADGGCIDARTSVSVVSEDGQPQLLIAQIEEVTASKRTSRALEESAASLQAILDNAPAAVAMKDLDGRYILVNRMAGRLCGLEPEEFVGKTARDLSLPEGDVDATLAADEEVLASERPVAMEREVETPDGWMTLFTEKFPVRDARGAIYAIAGVSVDISDRVAVEKENRRLEAALQEARRLETVGGLAGGIAHDFNNLLAVILNYAALAREEVREGSSIAEELEEIRCAAERAAELTSKLLVFSRQERFEPRPLDLNRVVVHAEWLLRRTLGEHIELWVELGDDLLPVEGDASQLEAALLNLAVNAGHAMPHGGTLSIRTDNVTIGPSEGPPTVRAGRYVRLSTTDTGSGMDAAVAARAFDPFFTTKPTGEGTGLGLAAVHGIAHQAGGAVELSSRPGGGTTVTIYLPVSNQRPARDSPPPEIQPLRGDGQSILVVEDEPSVRRMINRILTRAGYSVREAPPMEALEACARPDTRADLLLTDVVMPSISGGELAARASDLSPTVKVLFMSGYVDEARLGPAGHQLMPLLRKPFSPERLLRAVQAALQDPAAAEGEEQAAPGRSAPRSPAAADPPRPGLHDQQAPDLRTAPSN